MARNTGAGMSLEPSESELATLDPFYNLKLLVCRVLKQPPPGIKFADTEDRGSAFAVAFSGELAIEPWYRKMLRGRGF
ncbi:MAG: hypothetical protein ABIJ09_21550 [Pseudomonadota bacterium]